MAEFTIRPYTHRGLYLLKAPTNTALEDFILNKYADSLELPDTSSYGFDIVGTDSGKARKSVPIKPKQLPKPRRRASRSVRFKSSSNLPSITVPGESATTDSLPKKTDFLKNPVGQMLQVEQGVLRRGSFMIPRGNTSTPLDSRLGRDRSNTTMSRRLSMAVGLQRKGSTGSARNLFARYGRNSPKLACIEDIAVGDLGKDTPPKDIRPRNIWLKLAPLIRNKSDVYNVRAAVQKPGACKVLEAALWYYFSTNIAEGVEEGVVSDLRERLANNFALFNFQVIGRLPKESCAFLQAKFHIILAFAVSCALRQAFEGSLGRFDSKFEAHVAQTLDGLLCSANHKPRFYEREIRSIFPAAFDRSGGPIRIRGAQVKSADSEERGSVVSVDSMMDLMVDTLVAKDPTEVPGGAPTAMMLHARWQAVLKMGPGAVQDDKYIGNDPLRDLDLLPVPTVSTASTYTSSQHTSRVSPMARRRIKPTKHRHYAIAPVLKEYVPDRGEGFHGDLQLHSTEEMTVEEEMEITRNQREDHLSAQTKFNREHEVIRDKHRMTAERFHEYNRREHARFLDKWARQEADMTTKLDIEWSRKMDDMERHLKSAMLRRSDSDSELTATFQVVNQTLQEEMWGSALAASEAQDVFLDEVKQIQKNMALSMPNIAVEGVEVVTAPTTVESPAPKKTTPEREGPLMGGGWGHYGIHPPRFNRTTEVTGDVDPAAQQSESEESYIASDAGPLEFIRSCTPKPDEKRNTLKNDLVARSSPHLLAVWTANNDRNSRSNPKIRRRDSKTPKRQTTPRPKF